MILWDLLRHPKPDGKIWRQICDLLPGNADLAQVRQAVARWPIEIPRPVPSHWPPAWRTLEHIVREDEALYRYYIKQICSDPRLQNHIILWRQPRGVIHLADGSTMTLGGGQPGAADLGGCMAVGGYNLYVEVEVKLDGKIPPGAIEYQGTSHRQMTQTETDQCRRQRAMISRGGCYIITDRVSDAITRLVDYQTRVTRTVDPR